MAHPLLQTTVLDQLFSMLNVFELHVARDVCCTWREVVDHRLRTFSTLHWDFWQAEAADEQQLQLPHLWQFISDTVRSCPFTAGHALVFCGSTSQPGLSQLPCCVSAQLRRLQPDIVVYAFDSHCQQLQTGRVIGTRLRAADSAVHKCLRASSPAAVGLVLVRAAVGLRLGVAPISTDRQLLAGQLQDLWPAALLLLSTGHVTHRDGLILLRRLAATLDARLALGGGIVSACHVLDKDPCSTCHVFDKQPCSTWRRPFSSACCSCHERASLVWFGGSGVRAASCVLHGASNKDRCQQFIRQLQQLRFPQHNSVALLFANCLFRDSHYTDFECRLFRRAFPSVPVFGLGTSRQVGRHSEKPPASSSSRTHPYSLNRSITFVLLHFSV